MKLIQNIAIPTGNILIGETQRGKLEFLSIGDYGQSVNLNQHKKVEHGPLQPLEEKWVITISTQYGCSMGCKFCDVPKVGPGRNASYQDMLGEINGAMSLHPEVEYSERLNVHFARMGEPSWNPDVLGIAYSLSDFSDFRVHPVVSTMMPRANKHLEAFLGMWMHIKNEVYGGNAGLQLSINSTDAQERREMFNWNSMELEEIANLACRLPAPKGRKITLNFAVADYKIDAPYLAALFDPDHFIVKLTPMHKTNSALANGIQTVGDYTESYPYDQHEADLKAAGFEVLVFIASKEEDLGLITCGNAVLSGRLPEVPYTLTNL